MHTNALRSCVIAAIAALGSVGVATSAHAAQIGQLCTHVGTAWNPYTGVFAAETGTAQLYTLVPGDSFRIEGWRQSSAYYYGHAYQRASGFAARIAFDQSSCHF